MSKPLRVAIVGGGVTGLALAHALEKTLAGVPSEVCLLEASPRLGGNVHTFIHNGFVADGGPDSWVATKPHATALAKELGLEDELIGTIPENRRVYIAWGGKLHALPEGLVLGIPTEILPMVGTDLFSWDAKLRMALDLVVPPRTFGPGDDESIAAFVGRRLGDDVADRLVGPLLSGIFAGDAGDLSIRATFPQLVDAEQKHGSLVRAMRVQLRERRSKSGERGGAPSMFLSLKRGMSDFVTTLAHRLRDAVVVTDAPVTRVEALPEGDPRGRWALTVAHGDARFADVVVGTTPAYAFADPVRTLDPALADALSALTYVSTATVFLGFKKRDVAHPLDATGFIVPRSMGRPMLASTWVSSKWEHRAPSGHVLVRVFFGGAEGERLLDRDDAELAELARTELGAFVGLSGRPAFTKVFRFDKKSPQPLVGHLGRVSKVKERLAMHPGLHYCGNGFDGSGIPDCVKQAEAIARVIADRGAT